MSAVAEALFYIAVLIFILMIIGEPDVLDGLIKRANNIECVETPQ